MQSFAERKHFTREQLDLLDRATLLVKATPTWWKPTGTDWNPVPGEPPHDYGRPAIPELRCHELARAVGIVMGLPHQDGSYGIMEHTWLWTSPLRPFGRVATPLPLILDVYSPGRSPQVQLIDWDAPLPERTAYKPGDERNDIKHGLVEHLISFMRFFEKNR